MSYLFLDNSSVAEIEQKVTENVGKNENGDYTCNICGKTYQKYHVMSMVTDRHRPDRIFSIFSLFCGCFSAFITFV